MFKRAERKKAKLRLALCAPSGAGKTYSALMIAQGLGGKIAMIDSERGSGELYSSLCEYDVCQLTAPYTPDKYVQAIKEAERAGYSVIIIDSLTHAWAGTGGLLEEVDKRKGNGNDFTAWRVVTPMHNALVNAMLDSSCHIVATMRTKTAYDMVKDERTGKIKPVKVGLAPVQRDGLEYEFTVVLDIDIDKHVATASKDRTSLFDGKVFVPNVSTGEELKAWLEQGVAPSQPAQQTQTQTSQPQQQPPTQTHDLEAVEFDIVTCNTEKELADYFLSLRLQGHPQRDAIAALCAKRKAELVQPAPTESATPPSGDKLSAAQNKAIQTYYSTCGLDRPAKLKHLSEFFQRTITTTNELSKNEASRLIEAFKQQEQAA